MLDVKLTEQMLDDSYLEQHAAELKVMSDRMTYFENLMNQNPEFFNENLSPVQRDVLKTKLNAFAGTFGLALSSVSSVKGVLINSHRLAQNSEQASEESLNELKEGAMNAFRNSLREYPGQLEQTYDRVLEETRLEERDALMADHELLKGWAESQPELSGLGLTSYATEFSYNNMKDMRDMIEQNPENYAQYTDAVNDIYQRAYRAIDAMGDYTLLSRSYQQVRDRYALSAIPEEQKLESLAMKKVEFYAEEMKGLEHQQDDCKVALEFFLKDRKLTDESRTLLERAGHAPAVARKVFRGRGGAVENSNLSYEKRLASTNKPTEARSEGLLQLGIRDSHTEAAKANKMLLGNTFDALPKEYVTYFHELENDRNVNLATIGNNMVKTQRGMGHFTVGEGFDAITERMMGMFIGYLTSPASIQYFKEMISNIKDANVFTKNAQGETVPGRNKQAAAEYLALGLATNYGAGFVNVNNEARDGAYKDGDNVRNVAIESCRTILNISGMPGQVSDEEVSGMPEHIQRLLGQYKAALNSIVAQVP
ncbi:MAG: hypothetical protein LUC90_03075 [Lachnospiraceae bacterium]|nr:hypothetical protein [Lachnospiraceae bacterium]